MKNKPGNNRRDKHLKTVNSKTRKGDVAFCIVKLLLVVCMY